MESPYRDAVVSVIDHDLREELFKAEEELISRISEEAAAKVRAVELIRTGHFEGRPFEVLEFELEKEYVEKLRYHRAKLAKKIRWILEAWRDQADD